MGALALSAGGNAVLWPRRPLRVKLCCRSSGGSQPEQTPDEGSWEIIGIGMSSFGRG